MTLHLLTGCVTWWELNESPLVDPLLNPSLLQLQDAHLLTLVALSIIFAQVDITKNHKLSDFKDRINFLIALEAGGPGSRSRQVGLFQRPLPLACGQSPSPSVFMWPVFYMWASLVSLPLLKRTPVLLG